MKYHSVTYSGPLVRTIGAMKLIATSSSPTCASGSIQTGVSPHSTPCACPSRMPTAVDSTTTCQAAKMKYESGRLSTGLQRQPRNRPVQCAQKALARKP